MSIEGATRTMRADSSTAVRDLGGQAPEAFVSKILRAVRAAKACAESRKKEKGGRSPLNERETRELVAVPASAVPATSPTATGLGTGFVDGQRAAAVLLPGETRDRIARLVVVRELDEPKPLGPPRVSVRDHCHGLHVAVLGEKVAKILLAGAVGKVTDIELHRNRTSNRRLVSSDSVAPLDVADFPLEFVGLLRARMRARKASDTRRRVV